MTPSLTMCTRYTRLGASSRLRFHCYADALRDAGYQVRLDAFYPDDYLRKLYAGSGPSRFLAARALAARLWHTLTLPERLIVEYELLPFVPFSIEKRLLGNRRYILNFDDNVWEKYADSPRLRDKYDQLIAEAAGVIAANAFLREKVSKFNSRVIEIPTAVESADYQLDVPKRPGLALCWIGTPVTYFYLERFAYALRAMASKVDFTLVVIARKSLESRRIDGVKQEFLDWSEATEATEIKRCHIGIMPLLDDDFSRGKSAYKLIQCLAAGLPVIASPVGENCRVVNDACGFLADAPSEWSAALEKLTDPAFYQTLAAGATERSRDYSLETWRPRYVDFVKTCFGDE